MSDIVLKTDFNDVTLLRRGKVRDVYEIHGYLLIVATDRVSAFDVVLPDGISGKGKFLTRISLYWFSQMRDIIQNHIVATDVQDYPAVLHKYKEVLEGRSMLVKKAQPMPVECIVRGYLSGSGWAEYKEKATVCGIRLPPGLVESSRLDEPIFTPSTKAEEGHDINISFDAMRKIVGDTTTRQLKETTLAVYGRARALAEKKGIIIADTKMEFGLHEGSLMLIDELLTPDSSRFWSAKEYKPGSGQDSFDKQIIRDYLNSTGWNKTPPPPELPDDIILKTVSKYNELQNIISMIV